MLLFYRKVISTEIDLSAHIFNNLIGGQIVREKREWISVTASELVILTLHHRRGVNSTIRMRLWLILRRRLHYRDQVSVSLIIVVVNGSCDCFLGGDVLTC